MVVVCDLDGTIIKINSYKHWVVWVVGLSVLTFNTQVLRVAWRFWSDRRSGCADRWETKKRLIGLSEASVILDIFTRHLFSRYLLRFVRKDIVHILRSLHSGQCQMILATAADHRYCCIIKEKLGFGKLVATANGVETIGSEKLAAVAQACDMDNSYVLVLTDHHDDIPLAKEADEVILIKPGYETIERFIAEGITCRLLP